MVNEDEDLSRSVHLTVKRLGLLLLFAALGRAIELSLHNNSRIPASIDLTASSEDDDDESFQQDLNTALEASRLSFTGQQQQQLALQSDASNASTTQSSFLSERAKLERERLERQKRLRPDTLIRRETVGNSEEDEDQPPSKKHHGFLSSSVAGPSAGPSASSTSVQSSTSTTTTDRFFWDGELRQTAVIHGEPRKDGLPTFRLTEILGKVNFAGVARTPLPPLI